MASWRLIQKTWCNWPPRPKGVIEMIGGSYLAATPHISYRRLLEGLSKKGLAIHAWSYVPGLDHQTQANEAWKNMRQCREILAKRIGTIPTSIRLGHSLGCKLHLLAPDGGRNSESLISLSFNNFGAERSIPMISKISPKLGFFTEYSPSPKETLRLIHERYLQPNNLLISFGDDKLDQSKFLLDCLQSRDNDATQSLKLQGDHLTPASIGLRGKLLGEWAEDSYRANNLEALINSIYSWASN